MYVEQSAAPVTVQTTLCLLLSSLTAKLFHHHALSAVSAEAAHLFWHQIYSSSNLPGTIPVSLNPRNTPPSSFPASIVLFSQTHCNKMALTTIFVIDHARPCLFRPEMQAGLMNFQYLNQPIMDSGIVVE
jgi:hypothetical protein